MQGGKLQGPPADPTWLNEIQQAWVAYWESALAEILSPVDLPALRRLFMAYDRHERMLALVRETPFIDHHGDVRSNPADMVIQRLEGQISALEAQFGLTPSSRKKLQITVGQAALTADEVNRMVTRANMPSEAGKDAIEAQWEAID